MKTVKKLIKPSSAANCISTVAESLHVFDTMYQTVSASSSFSAEERSTFYNQICLGWLWFHLPFLWPAIISIWWPAEAQNQIDCSDRPGVLGYDGIAPTWASATAQPFSCAGAFTASDHSDYIDFDGHAKLTIDLVWINRCIQASHYTLLRRTTPQSAAL